MRSSNTSLTVLILFVAAYAPFAYADTSDAALATMAKILISLQHFPTDTDKEALAEISSGDSSDSVKTLAGAIAGISHKVGVADKAALDAIAADDNESVKVRELATIVVGLNHMPGADAKASLKALASL